MWLSLFFLFSGLSVANSQNAPRNELELKLGRHWMEALRNTSHSGSSGALNGWRPGAFAAECAFTYRLDPKWAFGVMLSLTDAPFTYVYEKDYALLGYPEVGKRLNKEVLEHQWLPGLSLGLGRRWELGSRWGFMLKAHYGIQFMNGSTTRYREFSLSSDPDSAQLTLVRMDSFNEGGGLLPFIRIGASLDRMFTNWNRLGLEVFALYSFRRDTFRSSYMLYPGTSGESSGTIEGGVSHAGLRLSYALTWGPPKDPAYLRRAARQ